MSLDLFEVVRNTKHLFTDASRTAGKWAVDWMMKKQLFLRAEDRITFFWILLCTMLVFIPIIIAFYQKFGKKEDPNKILRYYVHEVHRIASKLNPSTESITRCIGILNHCPYLINHPKSPYNYTPFLRACWSGNMTLVRYMLKNGANINSMTSSRETPIYLAAYRLVKSKTWNPSILDLLHKAGCQLSVPNVKGSTALHYAAFAGHLSLTRWLLMRGAHRSLKLMSGPTPYDLAISFRDDSHRDVAILLKIYCPELVEMEMLIHKQSGHLLHIL